MPDAPADRPRKERAENAAKRRRQLIRATIDSIALRGLSGTTLATVATEAGLSQGSAVFYFKTKDQLFAETLRACYDDYKNAWRAVFDTPHDDPVRHLLAFVMVDLSDEVCTRRDLTLWHAFWGDTRARPVFAEIAEAADADRIAHLVELANAAAGDIDAQSWTARSFAQAVDALTDGLWLQLHIERRDVSLGTARAALAQFVASAFPNRRDKILAWAAATSGGARDG